MPRADTQSELRKEELRLKKKRRQRFWGAVVLIAVAVIVLPLLLDGAGTQSQFRRVENLQEEPESLIGADIAERSIFQPVMPADESRVAPEPTNAPERLDLTESTAADSVIAEATTPVATPATTPTATQAPAQTAAQSDIVEAPQENRALLTAWVVQAAAFTDEERALLLRDRLRKAGFASFVRDREASSDPFRVLVGPMIKEDTAQKTKTRVAKLLNLELPSVKTEPEIMVYP